MSTTKFLPTARWAPSQRTVLVAFGLVVAVRFVTLATLHVWSVRSGNGGFGVLATGDGDDGMWYFTWATRLAHGGGLGSVKNGYPTVLSVLIRLGIRSVLALKVVNTLIGLTTPLLGAAMVRAVVSDPIQRARAQIVVILLVGLYPSNVYVAAHSLLRDAWIFAFMLAVAYLSVRILDTTATSGFRRIRVALEAGTTASLRALSLAVVAVLFLAWFRFYAAAVMLGGLTLALALDSRPWRRLLRRSPKGCRIFGLLSPVVFFVLVSVARWPIGRVFDNYPLSYRSHVNLVGGSSLGLRYGSNPIVNLGTYLYSLVSNTFGPLPWQVDRAPMLIPLVVETPLLAYVTWTLIRRRPVTWPFATRVWLTTALLWFAMLGVWNDNLGAGLRLRAPGWILLMVCAATLQDVPSRQSVPAPERVA